MKLIVNLCLFLVLALNARLSSGQATKMSLYQGETLNRGQSLTSRSGIYRAEMQNDGNFVLYESTHPIWHTNTANSDRITLQSDGNLVVYNGNNPTWASGTQYKGYRLDLQDDGNLVLYDNNNQAVWATNTNKKTNNDNIGTFATLQNDGSIAVFNTNGAIWNNQHDV